MNYGIRKDDLSFKIEDLENFGYGYEQYFTYKVCGNKTIVTFFGSIVGEVDNDTTLGDMKIFLETVRRDVGKYDINNENYDMLNDFVSEIESKTGRKVDMIRLNRKGYELTVDGEKITLPYTEEGKVNIDDVTSRVTPKEKSTIYSASDVLDDENKVVVEKYLNEAFGNKVEAKIVRNKDGLYEIQLNGEVFTTLEEGTTLAGAIKSVSSELETGKSIRSYAPDTTSNRLRAETGQNYKVHIDVEMFGEIQKHHEKAFEIIDESKNIYKVEFTDKLNKFYDSLIAANEEKIPEKRIEKSLELLDNITLNVKYSLQAYENIDHELGMIFNSVVSDIFDMNVYTDPETTEFYNKPLEEREQYLQNLIETYQDQVNELKKEFNEKYGSGIPIDWNEFQEVWPLLEASGIFTNCGIGGNGVRNLVKDGKDFYTMDPANLSAIISYCEENQVFENIENYLNGASFKDTIGKWYNCPQFTLGRENLDDKAYLYMENEFLRSCVQYMEPINNRDTIWGDSELYINDYQDPSISEWYIPCKDFVRDILIEQKVINVSSDNIIKFDKIPFMDDGKKQVEDYERLVNDINGLTSTIYNYKQYKGIMPFEAEMTGEEYLNYLVQDYSGLTGDNRFNYLDQREIALYQMYMSTGRQDRAREYLNAMDDLINQRIGFQEAAERVMSYQGAGGYFLSDAHGLGDGVEKFFGNLINCVAADGKRSAADYRDMYMVSLLGEENIYNDHLSNEEKFFLKTNYELMYSIGQQAIPTLVAFVPGVGPTASSVLQLGSSFGASRENALLSGASGAKAYLYATLSCVSTAVLNKCMGKIMSFGTNDSAASSSLEKFLSSLGPNAGRTVVSTYLDGGLRSMILGEPFDISKLTERGLDSALKGAFASTIMYGGKTLVLKVANGVTIKVTGGQKNYEQFCKEVEQKMWKSSAGKKVLGLKTVGGKVWKQYKDAHPNSMLVRMADKYCSPDMPICIDSETAKRMGITLRDGESLVYNPENNYYQRIDSKGNSYNIPASSIGNYEGGMYIELTDAEKRSLRMKNPPTYIISDEDGNEVATISEGKFNESIQSGKKPALWSGIDEEGRVKMNEQYTTLGTVADYDDDAPYDSYHGGSNRFASMISDYEDPETGEKISDVALIIPNDRNINDPSSYGNILKTDELPQLIKDGSVSTVTITSVDPNTMEVTGEVTIDIRPLANKYNDWSVPGIEDDGMDTELFNNFMDIVNEQTGGR